MRWTPSLAARRGARRGAASRHASSTSAAAAACGPCPWPPPAALVTVVEPNPNALATLHRRADDAGVADRIAAVQADSDALGHVVPPGSADLVLAHGLLEVVDDPHGAVAALAGAARARRRGVRPGRQPLLRRAAPGAGRAARRCPPACSTTRTGSSAGEAAAAPVRRRRSLDRAARPRAGSAGRARPGRGASPTSCPAPSGGEPRRAEALAELERSPPSRRRSATSPPACTPGPQTGAVGPTPPRIRWHVPMTSRRRCAKLGSEHAEHFGRYR